MSTLTVLDRKARTADSTEYRRCCPSGKSLPFEELFRPERVSHEHAWSPVRRNVFARISNNDFLLSAGSGERAVPARQPGVILEPCSGSLPHGRRVRIYPENRVRLAGGRRHRARPTSELNDIPLLVVERGWLVRKVSVIDGDHNVLSREYENYDSILDIESAGVKTDTQPPDCEDAETFQITNIRVIVRVFTGKEINKDLIE